MFMLLKHYHKDFVPGNLLDFVPDRTPAIMAYFCTLHGENVTSKRQMNITSSLCCEKLYDDFNKDFIPIFKTIETNDRDLFDKLISIASSTLKFGEIGDLGVWKSLLESLLRYEKTENNEIVVSFAGYYGSLIMRSVKLVGGVYKLTKNNNYLLSNKQPIPAIWVTITLIHSVLEQKSFICRKKANDLSEQIFFCSGIDITNGNDWAKYSVYKYFCDPIGKDYIDTSKIITSKTPYLELLHLIRNKICLLRSLFSINEVKLQMPSCLYEWTRELLMFLKKNTD
jgi:hypothetical protein